MFARLNLSVSFYLYLYLKSHEKCFFFRRWVTWSWHIQRWNGSCILFPWLPCAWLRFRHAKLTAGGEGRVWILPIECVRFFSLFLPFSIFSRSNAYTHTNKEGVKTRGKAERRQITVRFTRFLDYRLMFDSERSFSLKYDLILPPY